MQCHGYVFHFHNGQENLFLAADKDGEPTIVKQLIKASIFNTEFEANEFGKHIRFCTKTLFWRDSTSNLWSDYKIRKLVLNV